jgi:P-type E1-E2 ATPase
MALVAGFLAWAWSDDPVRFLAVLVVATPCPLLIAIPVAIIGSISLCAKRGIIIKDPVSLEQANNCRTAIFDKTGTLTYGEPELTSQVCGAAFGEEETLALVASLEQYSRHPLSAAIVRKAQQSNFRLQEATEICEPPGQGLRGRVNGHEILVTSRKKIAADAAMGEGILQLPPAESGLECVIVMDGKLAALYRFRDEIRKEGKSFIGHLGLRHNVKRLLIVSGDREAEVRYLADQVGISHIFGGQSPEQKVAIVKEETRQSPTLYIGDGINDAPALMAATVGLAIGQSNQVTSEAAGAVLLDTSLSRVDEFLHISRRMRSIALQSSVGGIALSMGGMIFAATGHLPPAAGALVQELIDVFAVLNALRAARRPKQLTDFEH